jgi:hypothetical protein
MKHSLFLLGNIILGIMLTSTAYAMDPEQTPLIARTDSGFELVIIEDAITIQQAYDKGLRANKEGHLVFINQNLSSCAGLSALKNKLHLDSITYLNFSNNKLQEVPAEIFTTMPNLVRCDLSGNHITKMCDPIPPHQKLKTLLLYNNQLTHIPLEQLLQNVPLKQLTLDENKITSYELLRTDHPSLEELWLGKNVQKWLKQMIASRCPNLVAEMCEGDTTVQDMNTKVEYSEKCLDRCCAASAVSSIISGVSAFGAGIVTHIGCLIEHHTTHKCWDAMKNSQLGLTGNVLLILLGGLGAGALIGGSTGAVCAVYCCTKPEERITKTILKQIAKYPPIVETLKKQAQDKTDTHKETI